MISHSVPAILTWTQKGSASYVWAVTACRPGQYSPAPLFLALGMIVVACSSGGGGGTVAPSPPPPPSGGWTATGSLNTARDSHTATVLTVGPNAGRVLVAGGS